MAIIYGMKEKDFTDYISELRSKGFISIISEGKNSFSADDSSGNKIETEYDPFRETIMLTYTYSNVPEN